MSYKTVNPILQFNFQINRVLAYGESACDIQEVIAKTATIRTFADWEKTWSALGQKAEQQQQFLPAAYYYRMAEFFLFEKDSRKRNYYQKSIDLFYKAFDTQLHLHYEPHHIPFGGGWLNCIKLPTAHPVGTIIVCGGYDSFIEEFVLQGKDLASGRYDVILFEGPGQGRCLQQNMYFRYDFEAVTAAVLDYFRLEHCAMVGISWGGYFAMRSAAYEKRITCVAAYDVMDDGFEVMTHVFPFLLCKIIRLAYRLDHDSLLNAMVNRLRRKSILADWAISQGMYITGTKTPYAFYRSLSHHTLHDVSGQITQDVLLLAGEKDHYIPLHQFYRLKNNLPHAHSVTCRLFTQAEGGEQHCQVGSHLSALHTIIDWLDRFYLS